MALVFCRRASAGDLEAIRKEGEVSHAFVTVSVGKQRLVVEYYKANDCLEERKFRMEQLVEAAPLLRRKGLLFKVDIKDGNLRIRQQDQPYLDLSVSDGVYVPIFLN